MIDWQNFTPVNAASGGVLIGIAVAILLFFNGRIAGISGILGGLFNFKKHDTAWRLAFLAGLVFSASIWCLAADLPAIQLDASLSTIFVAGILVGVGTSFASGCTSGHGVCGLSRISPRSLVATLIFMATGIVTVFIVRHVLGA
jgi:uncharacterized membrane protein YedE/YeeE